MFRYFLQFIKKQYKKHEKFIRQNHVQLANAMDAFKNEVETDIKDNLITIDYYMRDLKTRALTEYDDLWQREQESAQTSQDLLMNGQVPVNSNPGNAHSQTSAASKNKKRKNKKKNESTQNSSSSGVGTNTTFSQYASANDNGIGGGGKKGKKTKASSAKKKEDKLSNEELMKLDTDALCEFIE